MGNQRKSRASFRKARAFYLLHRMPVGRFFDVGHSARNLRSRRAFSTSWEIALDRRQDRSLAREIADLETIVVGNEREALALEHNLIKAVSSEIHVVLR